MVSRHSNPSASPSPCNKAPPQCLIPGSLPPLAAVLSSPVLSARFFMPAAHLVSSVAEFPLVQAPCVRRDWKESRFERLSRSTIEVRLTLSFLAANPLSMIGATGSTVAPRSRLRKTIRRPSPACRRAFRRSTPDAVGLVPYRAHDFSENSSSLAPVNLRSHEGPNRPVAGSGGGQYRSPPNVIPAADALAMPPKFRNDLRSEDVRATQWFRKPRNSAFTPKRVAMVP